MATKQIAIIVLICFVMAFIVVKTINNSNRKVVEFVGALQEKEIKIFEFDGKKYFIGSAEK